MPLSRSAALIHGNQPHHLDHLAPLAIELNIPLIVTESNLKYLADKYYPTLNTLLINALYLGQTVIQNYDTLFSSLPRDLIDQIFFIAQTTYKKRLTSIWCPHGNSDKGHRSFLIEALQKEKIALVYGRKMLDFLREKKAYDQLDTALLIGNYRYHFYKQRASFYNAVVTRDILSKLPPSNTNFLYAPTWKDSENSTSFFSAFPHMVKKWPPNWNLIVKLHPNLLLEHPYKTELLIDLAAKKRNVVVVNNFPPIYPLLSAVDIYLGDMSSIGYDYLTFNRPMFFLNETNRNPKTDPGLFLFRCGRVIKRSDYQNLPALIEKTISYDQKCFQKIRKELYGYVFEPNCKAPSLKEKIKEVLNELNPSS